MAATLEWNGNALDLRLWPEADIVGRVGIVRARADGITCYYVTAVVMRRVSEPYQREEDARQDCESEVRRLLKEAGVTLAD